MKVLWRETGAKPAKPRSGAVKSGGGCESGRAGRKMSAGSGRSPVRWHAASQIEGREGRRRTTPSPYPLPRWGEGQARGAPSMALDVTLHVLTCEPLAEFTRNCSLGYGSTKRLLGAQMAMKDMETWCESYFSVPLKQVLRLWARLSRCA